MKILATLQCVRVHFLIPCTITLLCVLGAPLDKWPSHVAVDHTAMVIKIYRVNMHGGGNYHYSIYMLYMHVPGTM